MPSDKSKTPRAKMNVLMLAYVAFVTLGPPTGLLGVAWIHLGLHGLDEVRILNASYKERAAKLQPGPIDERMKR